MSRLTATILTACILAAGAALSFTYRADAPVSDQPGRAGAACPSGRSTEDYRNRAEIVLTGSVFAVLQNSDGTADVLITPQTFYKGRAPERGITIAARPLTGGQGGTDGSNDLHFTSEDPPYLLFLTQRSDGRFQTSRCNGSRRLDQGLTAAEQTVLESGRP